MEYNRYMETGCNNSSDTGDPAWPVGIAIPARRLLDASDVLPEQLGITCFWKDMLNVR